ncbi:hypothetical protein BDR06DRAFT_984757 [Suillus hirtellus]|nr:hypothetical protein BDR06DRAFT_984757 [Suillus hirtellus]
MAGLYSGKIVLNYVHSIHTWHILHSQPWTINDDKIMTLLKAANNLTPATSKKKKCQPYMVNFIKALLRKLDTNNPLIAAVHACLTITFYTMACVGEFTVPSINGFNPSLHITRTDNSLQTTTFHLLHTKSSPTGEDISSLENHYHINDPPENIALFSYKHKKGHCILTKSKFIAYLAQATTDAGLIPLQGYGIRIGTTLEYLFCNILFDVVKTMGHWASDIFQLYLCKYAQILTPYLQATPALHDEYLRYTMPHVH